MEQTKLALTNVIDQWKQTAPADATYKHLFMNVLHHSPYYLRYSLDNRRPNLLMIYTTEQSDTNNQAVLEANGIILNNESFDIIAMGMPTLINTESVKELPRNGNESIELSEDGTVLRVFWYENEWVVSTNRRIDAKRVKWASDRNFYELMAEAAWFGLNCPSSGTDLQQVFESYLDKSCVHSFILLHPESELVISHSTPTLVYVSCRNLDTMQEIEYVNVPFARLPRRLSQSDVETIFTRHVDEFTDLLVTKRGVICSDWSNPKLVKRYKLDFPHFREAEILRKNMPTMELSYLSAVDDNERALLRKYFPRYNTVFNALDHKYFVTVRNLHALYKECFIRKLYFLQPTDDTYHIIRQIHQHYRYTKEAVTQDIVNSILAQSCPFYLHLLLDKEGKAVDKVPYHVQAATFG